MHQILWCKQPSMHQILWCKQPQLASGLLTITRDTTELPGPESPQGRQRAVLLLLDQVGTAQDGLCFSERIHLVGTRFLTRIKIGKKPVAVLVEDLKLIIGSLHLGECTFQHILMSLKSAFRIRLGGSLVLEDL